MKINHVLIAGAGAVGLTVADTIFGYDPASVSVLARGERLERYRKNGLLVNGEKKAFRITEEEKADLIIVACKFHHLQQIIRDMKPSVGKDTIILSLLNGISSEDIIGAGLGRERLPLAMIIGTDAFHKNEETIVSKRGVIHFGSGEGENGAREDAVAEFFTRASVAFELEKNMRRSLWYKFMINIGLNQTTAILRLPYAAVQSIGGPREINEARALVENAMREVLAVANAEGIDLTEADLKNWPNSVNHLNPESYTSMCQDVLAGRKTELEMFCMSLIEMGKKHGIKLPVNETFFLQLKTIEQAGQFFNT